MCVVALLSHTLSPLNSRTCAHTHAHTCMHAMVMAAHAHETVAARKLRKKFVAASVHEQSTGLSYQSHTRSREKKIGEGKLLLKQRLDFLKLARVEMEGDGNCQLRAFSTELFGTQEFHLFARSVAVEWLDQHAAEFSFFVGEQILETKILIPSGESKENR